MVCRARMAAVPLVAVFLMSVAVAAPPHGDRPATPHAEPAPDARARTIAQAPTPRKPKGKAVTPRSWPELQAGNRRFVAGDHLVHAVRELRAALATGQQPDVVVLTCSDSRVSPEWIFDQPLGELFVVRTAGHVVDPIALGSIEYAVEHLHARLIVVMGHDECGAVAAAVSGDSMPTEHLDSIMRKIRPGIPPARPGASRAETLAAAVAANVRRSATDVVIASPVVREHVVHGSVEVIQAVYHLASGRVEELRTPDALSGSEHD